MGLFDEHPHHACCHIGLFFKLHPVERFHHHNPEILRTEICYLSLIESRKRGTTSGPPGFAPALSLQQTLSSPGTDW